MTEPAENPALALRQILRALMRDDVTLDKAWHRLLGAGISSPEFALRHSEVIALFRQVNDLLQGLPEGDEDRQQYLTYMPHYYTALVNPEKWSGIAGSNIADPNIVDHLTGIASTLRYRALATPTVSDDAVERLRASITEWRAILDEAEFDDKLTAELHSQVNHLEFLLDNMPLLGSRPVAEASKKLVGTSLVAMAARPSFAKRIGKAVAAAVACVTLVHAGVTETTGILEGVAEMSDAVVEIFAPQKQLKAPPDVKELTTGRDDGNVIDGEVVDDDPPESPTPEDGAQG